jgi:hypothetical protein
LHTELEASSDTGRRSGSLAEARRKRLTWIEEARFAFLSEQIIAADSNSRIKGVRTLDGVEIALAFLTPQHSNLATASHAHWSDAEQQLRALHRKAAIYTTVLPLCNDTAWRCNNSNNNISDCR